MLNNEKKFKSKLLVINTRNEIKDHWYSKMRLTGGRITQLYSIPKQNKAEIPLRPVPILLGSSYENHNKMFVKEF